MRKKHSIGRFIVITLICAVFLCLTIFSFSLPGAQSDYDFNGFARAINLGIEFKGGSVYHYTIKNNNDQSNVFDGGLSANALRIKNLLQNNSYQANVYQNGGEMIVELEDEFSPISIDQIVNADAYFAIKGESGDDAEVKLSAKDITDAYSTSEQGGVLVMVFTTEGQNALAELTSSGSGTIYFYFGEKQVPMQYDSTYNQNYLGIVVGSVETADYYVSEIVSSRYDISLEQSQSYQISTEAANRNCLIAILSTVVLFAVCVAFLCAKYKKLGLVGSLILLVGILLQIVLLQAVPVFKLTATSLFASLLCLTMGAFAICMMFNSMHKQYKQGKIMTASVKFGFNSIWKTVLGVFLVALFPSIFAFFFGFEMVKYFALALICGLAVYLLCTLLLTKFFTKWLTNITYKNKDYGFSREAHVNELK